MVLPSKINPLHLSGRERRRSIGADFSRREKSAGFGPGYPNRPTFWKHERYDKLSHPPTLIAQGNEMWLCLSYNSEVWRLP